MTLPLKSTTVTPEFRQSTMRATSSVTTTSPRFDCPEIQMSAPSLSSGTRFEETMGGSPGLSAPATAPAPTAEREAGRLLTSTAGTRASMPFCALPSCCEAAPDDKTSPNRTRIEEKRNTCTRVLPD